MVRRFPTYPRYPNKFNRSIADDQSAIPSQHHEVPPPFDPSMHPEMIPTPPPQEPILSIVRHSFDSRPPNAVDFFWEDAFLAGVSLTDGFDVPAGYICIIRKITLSFYPVVGNEALGPSPSLDIYGNDTSQLFMTILVDGAGTTNWTPNTQGLGGVPILNAGAADTEFECFILVDQQQNFTIQIPDATDSLGTNVYVHYYGNMLLASGRSLNAEVGNKDPSLVTTMTEATGPNYMTEGGGPGSPAAR